MNEKNDSLIEIAFSEMKKKKKPKTLEKICKDVFEIKGIKYNEEEASQFQIDFMLSGKFICCGEDKNGEKLWDLKSRQSSSLLDKDGSYLEDPYDDDDEVANAELKDEMDSVYADEDKDGIYDDDDDDDDEDDDSEPDDIEEELMAGAYLDEDDDDDSEDNYDDKDE